MIPSKNDAKLESPSASEEGTPESGFFGAGDIVQRRDRSLLKDHGKDNSNSEEYERGSMRAAFIGVVAVVSGIAGAAYATLNAENQETLKKYGTLAVKRVELETEMNDALESHRRYSDPQAIAENSKRIRFLNAQAGALNTEIGRLKNHVLVWLELSALQPLPPINEDAVLEQK